MLNLNKFSIRHAMSAGCAVLIAGIVQYFFSFSHESWMMISALIVTQTTRGTPLKQGLQLVVVIFLAVLMAAFITINVYDIIFQYIILSFIFIVCGSIFLRKQLFFLIIFMLIILVATLQPTLTMQAFKYRLFDIAIGATLGMLCVQLILPINIANEFQQGLVPILTAMSEYLYELSEKIMVSDVVDISTNQIFQVQQTMYPEWVYEVGFNPGLRSGFRFFLINLERVGELFLSINHLFSAKNQVVIPNEMRKNLQEVLMTNAKLFDSLRDYFNKKSVHDAGSDFKTDINELEKTFKRLVPVNIDALDFADENMQLALLVHNLKEMRELLLKLVLSIPN